MKLIKVDGVARSKQDGDGGASESDFRFNLLSALPVIALNIFVAELLASPTASTRFISVARQAQWHQQ